jgi:hypothetical protein
MNPSVKSDDPLVANASVMGRTPVPQKIDVNPASTSTTHSPGRVTRAVGEYRLIVRSRLSNDLFGPAKTLNNRLSPTKWNLVKLVITARGTTTVLTADARVQSTNAAPAITATTCSTITRQLCHTLLR